MLSAQASAPGWPLWGSIEPVMAGSQITKNLEQAKKTMNLSKNVDNTVDYINNEKELLRLLGINALGDSWKSVNPSFMAFYKDKMYFLNDLDNYLTGSDGGGGLGGEEDGGGKEKKHKHKHKKDSWWDDVFGNGGSDKGKDKDKHKGNWWDYGGDKKHKHKHKHKGNDSDSDSDTSDSDSDSDSDSELGDVSDAWDGLFGEDGGKRKKGKNGKKHRKHKKHKD